MESIIEDTKGFHHEQWGLALHKNIVRVVISVVGLIGSQSVFAQGSSKALYQQRCAACHSVGGGRLVGPDLAGISNRRSERWLLRWTQSSQTLIQSGDPAAKALFDEFNKIVMPDQALSEEQIKGILAYIKEAEGQSATSVPATAEVTQEPSLDEIERGKNFFQGKIRFANGGPSCTSCHHVKNEAIMGGGILAKDLTTVSSRMGDQGIRAILMSAPFPVMSAAFEGKPVLDEEIRALIGFLKYADKETILHPPREYGWAMFGAGAGGVVVCLGFYSLVGRRRKRQSVNQAIYDRQIKSE